MCSSVSTTPVGHRDLVTASHRLVLTTPRRSLHLYLLPLRESLDPTWPPTNTRTTTSNSSSSIVYPAPMSGREDLLPKTHIKANLNRQIIWDTRDSTKLQRRASGPPSPVAIAEDARFVAAAQFAFSSLMLHTDSLLRLRADRRWPLLKLHEIQPRLHLHPSLCADASLCARAHCLAGSWTASAHVWRVRPASSPQRAWGCIWPTATRTAAAVSA